MFAELKNEQNEEQYQIAKERYNDFGINTDEVLRKLSDIPISIHCWQGDDVSGFEGAGELSGGILATGNYPGKPRTPDELRKDFEQALSLIPGNHRFNLHAIYLETDKKVDRDAIRLEHFKNWIDWAKELNLGLDFNPTFFSHPKADTGFTLASKDPDIRKFWIEHAKRCREVAAGIGRELGTACINNVWIPDGSKDFPADRLGYREILKTALDEVFEAEFKPDHLADAVESKLFGIGSEAFVVGSHDFYLCYALTRKVMLTMDAGHYHPTESIAEKISAILPFLDRLLLHVSRPMRWDSDHVVILDEETKAIAREVARAEAFDRVAIALDFFDASINRISAWVIGARSAIKAILLALLEPSALLADEEKKGNLGNRLALMEEFKTLPFAAVWDKYCLEAGVPVSASWLNKVAEYENAELKKR